MSVLNAAPPILPIHAEETILSIDRLHAEHRANATQHQRVVDLITSLLGGPSFIAALTVFIIGWMSLNGLAVSRGYRALDPPPFPWLAGAASLASLYLVVLILTTQRRDDRLTHRRELLNLELGILSEQKTAKVIALLEELRRDSPLVHNRVDELADAMGRPNGPTIGDRRDRGDALRRRARRPPYERRSPARGVGNIRSYCIVAKLVSCRCRYLFRSIRRKRYGGIYFPQLIQMDACS